jgi:CBS domain containing-hemolysin-like protein
MEQAFNRMADAAAAALQALAFDPALLAQPEILLRLLLFLLLLAASAFFSSAETALFSLSRLELQELRRDRHPQSDTIHALLDQPRKLIISILCGNELINVAATANMAAILLHLYTPAEVILVNLLVMVPLLLLFGEVTPKTIAVTDPMLVSTRITARPMAGWVRLITPLRWLARLASEKITSWLVGPEKAPENILHLDEFRTLVEEVVESGELHAAERVLIDNILAAGSTEVVEIMVPRTRVNFVDVDAGVPAIVEQVRSLRHRRLPAFRGHRDSLLGMLHAEDLMSRVLDHADLGAVRLEELLRPLPVVPPTKKVDELFNYFLQQNSDVAIVLNEFGGVEGMVTLKATINFIFGYATREEAESQSVVRRDDGVVEFDGALRLNHFNDLANLDLSDSRMTTVGGLVLRHLDRLPRVGDEVSVEGVRLRVAALEGHRIARLQWLPNGYPAATAVSEARDASEDEAAEQPARRDGGGADE